MILSLFYLHEFLIRTVPCLHLCSLEILRRWAFGMVVCIWMKNYILWPYSMGLCTSFTLLTLEVLTPWHISVCCDWFCVSDHCLRDIQIWCFRQHVRYNKRRWQYGPCLPHMCAVSWMEIYLLIINLNYAWMECICACMCYTTISNLNGYFLGALHKLYNTFLAFLTPPCNTMQHYGYPSCVTWYR